MDDGSAALWVDLIQALCARNHTLREQLRTLHPSDWRFEPLFQQLILVDKDVCLMRALRQEAKGAPA